MHIRSIKKLEEKNTKEKVSDKQMKRIAVRELRDKKAAILENARKSADVIDQEIKELSN